ncbi:hypothetical protein KI387_027251, partial [Taxus chinensis]
MATEDHNLKETELRLGLPGARSPVRENAKCCAPPPLTSSDENSSSSATSELCLLSPRRSAAAVVVEKNLFPGVGEETPAAEKYASYRLPQHSSSNNFQLKKRGFAEAMEKRNLFSGGGSWAFPAVKPPVVALPNGSASSSDVEASSRVTFQAQLTSPKGSGPVWQGESAYVSARTGTAGGVNMNGKCVMSEVGTSKEGAGQCKERVSQQGQASAPTDAPVSKQQVVGWPPVRSFRCKTLAANPKATEEGEGKAGANALYVKVSMDGAPYLRKVDLKMYSRYQELSSALEKMFSCFTIGQCGSHGIPGRDGLSESKLMDLLHGSEYVLTYEDKDGDWMLVGDVPWEMFVDSCKRLRIMKGSEAIGL